MKRVGFIGWRGMVGSVLMDRMLAEKDFSGFEPFFFSTSQVGQQGPAIGREVPLVEDAFKLEAPGGNGHHRVLPGRGLYREGAPPAATERLAGFLDRRGLNPPDGEGQCHHSRSGQPTRDRSGAIQRHQRFHRRQLHRFTDAHGIRRIV